MGQKAARRRGGRSALPSPGIPPPPPLSQEYLATIPEQHLRVIALTVQLHDRSSMTKCSNWFGAKAKTFLKPPLHILGGYSSWKDVLHGIRHYNEMSPGERQREAVKARGLTRKEKAQLKANMDRLMADRPDPTMECSVDDGGAEQLKQLTAAAAARSVAAMKHCSGEAIIRKREAATGRDIEGYAKRRKSACADCGFVRDARVLKAAKCELPQEPGECVQCIEAAKQWTKKLEKDARLAEIYHDQLERPQSCSEWSREVVVQLEAFLVNEFGREVAGELVHLLGMRQLCSGLQHNKTILRERGGAHCWCRVEVGRRAIASQYSPTAGRQSSRPLREDAKGKGREAVSAKLRVPHEQWLCANSS